MAKPARSGKLALFEVLNGSSGNADASSAAPAPARSAASSDERAMTLPAGVVRTAGIGLAAALTLAGAFVAGRVTAPAVATPADTGDVRPDVLDVGGSAAVAEAPPPAARLASTVSASVAPPVTLASTGQPAAVVPSTEVPAGPVERIAGLNYLLVQSYHASEREGAEATAAALRAAGIGATVETGIRGWSKNWCVIGTESFKRRTSNPEFDAYKSRVLAVGREASRDRRIKPFEPLLVQWGR